MITRTTDEVEQKLGKLRMMIERYMLLKKAYKKYGEVMSAHSQKVMELLFQDMRQILHKELDGIKKRDI